MALACTLLVGCATQQEPFQPPRACLVTQVKAPLTMNFQSTPVCTKKGESSAEFINIPLYPGCWSMSWGGCDVAKAAKDGNLSKVEYADYEYFSILGVYQKTTVTAYGQ